MFIVEGTLEAQIRFQCVSLCTAYTDEWWKRVVVDDKKETGQRLLGTHVPCANFYAV